MQRNKKASLFYSWPEYFFIVLLIIGIIVTITVKSKFLVLLIIFLCGFITGNLVFMHRRKLKFPLAIILIGFTVGFIIGVKTINPSVDVSWLSIVLVFVLGNAASYVLHREGVLPKQSM